MWPLPWFHANPHSAGNSAARLVLAGVLALFALGASNSGAISLTLLACPLACDFLCQHRWNGWAAARSVTVWMSLALVLIFLAAAYHILPERWIWWTLRAGRGHWDAGHFWAPLATQFFHRGWIHLGLNLTGIMLFGTRVEAIVGPRPYLGLILLAGLVTGFAPLVIQPLPWIHGASGIVMAVAAAWPALLLTRSGAVRLLESDRLAGAFLFVLFLHLSAIIAIVILHSARESHVAFVLSTLCGVASAIRFRRLQRRRFERLLKEFLARKQQRERRARARFSGAA